MTFGTEWGFGAEEETCREIYETFGEAGGSFVDTADVYTEGASETITGRLIAADRDAIVLGTKYTLPTDKNDPNSGGSHRKSLRRSVETSLRRLGTDYVDLLWVHAWDQCTPVEETLRALDDLVRAGKVLALGVSNTPAWVIARSDAIAELRGWSSFCALQLEYSLAARTPDRELLPMARTLGLAISAWSPLHPLDAVIEGVPTDETLSEVQVGLRGLVRLESPAPVGIRGVEGVLEGVVDVVERHFVAEIDARLDQDVPVDEARQLVAGHEAQADGVRSCLRLDRVQVALGQTAHVLGPVDGGNDRVSGFGQVQQILLAGHVTAARQRVVHPDTACSGLVAEGVVLLLIVQNRSAVADHDSIEPVHQGCGIQRVAQSDVEVRAKPGSEEDVLVAVAPPPCLVGEIGHEQNAGAGRHGASPRSEAINVTAPRCGPSGHRAGTDVVEVLDRAGLAPFSWWRASPPPVTAAHAFLTEQRLTPKADTPDSPSTVLWLPRRRRPGDGGDRCAGCTCRC
jgi:diketogulonate reductase-like aldo/keto reductase